MAEVFDVVVIGGGAVGEVAAGRAAGHGLSVALVEAELVGGECSYWACMPSKVLLRPGEVLAAARRVPGARAAVTGAVDPAATLASRDDVVHRYDDTSQVEWLEGAGVRLFRGRGTITGERTVTVDTGGALEARRAVILATGSTPVIPPIDGLAEARPWTSRDATAVKEVPRRFLVLGGGVVACEMAQAFRWLGSEEVTIVEKVGRLLPDEEPFAGRELMDAFDALGIDVRCGRTITSVRRGGDVVAATLDDGSVVYADELLVATGRRPNVDEPVEVDDRLRVVGSDWLYAVGDVNGRALLTHIGKHQARVAADVIAGLDVVDTAPVTRVVFTDPRVAAVGTTLAKAGDGAREVRVGLDSVAGATVAGDGVRGTAQLVVDEARRVAVGATFTGPDVGELLHSASVAIAGEVPLERLWQAVPAYPTISEVWLRLLEAYGL